MNEKVKRTENNLIKTTFNISYDKSISDESTKNLFDKNKFHTSDKIRNRVHLNNCKINNIDTTINKLHIDHSIQMNNNSLINIINNNNICHMEENSSWFLTGVPETESNINLTPNKPIGNISTKAMYSPLKNNNTNNINYNGRKFIEYNNSKINNEMNNSIFNEINSSMISTRDNIILNNSMLDNESKLLERFKKKDEWSIISSLSWIHYCINDVLKIYKQLSSYLVTIKNSQDLFEAFNVTNPLYGIYKVFQLLYAIIIFIECKSGDEVIDSNKIITMDILLQFESKFYLL